MAEQTRQDLRRQHDYAVALTRLFIEALNARDYEAVRVLVSEDVELRGPNGSSVRGYQAASELLETAAHLDLVVVRTALEDAASIAGLIVTTEATITEHPKKETPALPPGGGMGGMGGMDY